MPIFDESAAVTLYSKPPDEALNQVMSSATRRTVERVNVIVLVRSDSS